MPSKSYALEPMGYVTVTKRRGNRHLRLSITQSGQIRVSIPMWASYQAGLDFARSSQRWINHRLPEMQLLQTGQRIAPGFTLRFVAQSQLDRLRAKTENSMVTIMHPIDIDSTHTNVQSFAKTKLTKVLRQEAQNQLPKRLETLAKQHNINYRLLKIKLLKQRWGSCDQTGLIVLNLCLIQLPSELIDYVILHELAHTKHLNHSPEFWQALESICPNAHKLRQELRKYSPNIFINSIGLIFG